MLWYGRCFHGCVSSIDSGCDVRLNLLVYSEHHMLLWLLSLHLCNEYLSLLKKKKKKSRMHCTKAGISLCLAQPDLQEASTEACSTSPGLGLMRVCPYRLLRPV